MPVPSVGKSGECYLSRPITSGPHLTSSHPIELVLPPENGSVISYALNDFLDHVLDHIMCYDVLISTEISRDLAYVIAWLKT